MISEYYKNYCCEDPSLIENYELAINDTTQIWDCHHRGQILPCGRFSAEDLKKFNLYYNRPASELIFLPHDEHMRLHYKGVPKGQMSEAHKQAISDAKKGVQRPDLKGVALSEAHKQAISDALTGVPQPWKYKKILQFTKSGEFVREWAYAYEAHRELGISQGNICACCNGKRKSAGGYMWKYA